MQTDLIDKYFPGITQAQKEQFMMLSSLYEYWNTKINLISRKDIDNLVERHVLHSLSISFYVSFKSGAQVIDVGTGGGFPGIPLAILFPETYFHLIDGISKKIFVVNEIVHSLRLENVRAESLRAESINGSYDFVVSRAVSGLPEFYRNTGKLLSSQSKHSVSNGILYLKGGEMGAELNSLKKKYFIRKISDWYNEAYFESKLIVHILK